MTISLLSYDEYCIRVWGLLYEGTMETLYCIDWVSLYYTYVESFRVAWIVWVVAPRSWRALIQPDQSVCSNRVAEDERTPSLEFGEELKEVFKKNEMSANLPPNDKEWYGIRFVQYENGCCGLYSIDGSVLLRDTGSVLKYFVRVVYFVVYSITVQHSYWKSSTAKFFPLRLRGSCKIIIQRLSYSFFLLNLLLNWIQYSESVFWSQVW